MPEWEGYTKKAKEAGAKPAGDQCHRESGFIQEIAQEVAMRACQNVWVDGSLRDGAWFTKVFKDVRRRFPRYKIAIFEISASETIVRQRIKSRAAKTGRDVPEELIVGSLASVSKSLDMLTPLCDFVARIGNDDDAPMPPMLRAFIQVDNDGDWGRVEERFAQAESDIAFPRSLAPLRLVPVDVPMATYDKAKHSITLNLDYPALKHIADIVVDSTLRLTPLVSLQRLKSHSRKLANVPVEATSFCFSYPASLNWQALESGADIASDTACLLPLAGGFVYLNQKDEICQINAVSALMVEQEEEHATTDGVKPSILQFSSPLALPRPAKAVLDQEGRLRPVTLAALLEVGVHSFAWINPFEDLEGTLSAPPSAGAFAYVFAEAGEDRYFPVAA